MQNVFVIKEVAYDYPCSTRVAYQMEGPWGEGQVSRYHDGCFRSMYTQGWTSDDHRLQGLIERTCNLHNQSILDLRVRDERQENARTVLYHQWVEDTFGKKGEPAMVVYILKTTLRSEGTEMNLPQTSSLFPDLAVKEAIDKVNSLRPAGIEVICRVYEGEMTRAVVSYYPERPDHEQFIISVGGEWAAEYGLLDLEKRE